MDHYHNAASEFNRAATDLPTVVVVRDAIEDAYESDRLDQFKCISQTDDRQNVACCHLIVKHCKPIRRAPSQNLVARSQAFAKRPAPGSRVS